jgi:hypothetical protein
MRYHRLLLTWLLHVLTRHASLKDDVVEEIPEAKREESACGFMLLDSKRSWGRVLYAMHRCCFYLREKLGTDG